MTSRPHESDRRRHTARRATEEYLWDRSGSDLEIERFETMLSSLAYQPNRPRVAITKSSRESMHRAPLRAAAVLALCIIGVWMITSLTPASRLRKVSSAGQLTVTSLAGAPRLDDTMVQGSGALSAGQWLETNERSRAEIAVGALGTVQVEPGTRVRLVHARPSEHRLELARGSIIAAIAAPPRLFVVDTPAAAAVDLGCAYRLTVDDAGDGTIEVTGGWVSMESRGVASIVPRGAMCLTRKGVGAGIPFFADASPVLIRALRALDFEGGGEAALATVISEARERDSLTLWHLLARVSGSQRSRVFDCLEMIAPPPAGVIRDAIVRGDPAAIAAWRDTFIWSPNPPTSPTK